MVCVGLYSSAVNQPLVIDALGVHIGIETAGLDSSTVDAIGDAWLEVVCEGATATSVVRPRTGTDTASMLSELSRSVTLSAIEERKGQLWLLHAAGVALPDGRVVVFVAPSGGGKTTLSATLGTEFAYVSDETVGIDESGRVWPYRKPLSIIEDDSAPKAQRAPSGLGLKGLPEVPLRVAAIVLLDRREGVVEPVVEPVDLTGVLSELVAQTSFLTRMPTPLRTIARIIEEVGGVLRVTYCEGSSLAPLIATLAEPQERHRYVEEALTVRGQVTPGHAYHRGAMLDAVALTDPDRVVLLQVDARGQGTVRLLAGIAPALWRAASGTPLTGLVAAAVEAHGAPEGADAAELVGAAVEELIEAGVLELREPRWQIHPDAAWTGGDGRFVALPLSTPGEQPKILSGSAGLVWSALAEGAADAETVGARVAGAAGVGVALVREDVSAFLGELELASLAVQG